MRIISRARLKEFWERHADAEAPLERWYDLADHADWKNLPDVRSSMRSTDPVTVGSGNTVYVFNIGGNKYRLIAAIHFDKGRVFVLRILTHAEYDRERWKEEP